jgi:hypothetical protein
VKIALVGSAPSSITRAPYDDPEWTIWGCSPGAYSSLRRVDAFFELHRFDPDDPVWFREYVDWMKALACPLYMIEPLPEFPTSLAYPTEAMIARFGRNFFTSSLAWMAALAIVEIQRAMAASLSADPASDTDVSYEIAFYGVDMAASEEYGLQKPGCLYFIEKARDLGIKVTAPPESDLLRPLPMYGIGEASPMRIKLTIRQRELQGKVNECAAKASKANTEFEAAMREQMFYQGALDDLQYHLNTWCD